MRAGYKRGENRAGAELRVPAEGLQRPRSPPIILSQRPTEIPFQIPGATSG